MKREMTEAEAFDQWLTSYLQEQGTVGPAPTDWPEAALARAVRKYGQQLKPRATFVTSLEQRLRNAQVPGQGSAAPLGLGRLAALNRLLRQFSSIRLRPIYYMLAILIAFVAGVLAITLPGMLPAVQPQLNGFSNSGQRLLLYEWNAAANGTELRLLDAHSLADVPGRSPLFLGTIAWRSLSPDGRRLAVIVRTSGSGGKLHLIDLVTWTDRETSVTVENSPSQMTFSPDGKSLFWLTSVSAANFQLFRYELESSRLSALSGIPGSCRPGGPELLHVVRPSLRLVLYCVPSDGLLSTDAPHVISIDLASNRVIGDLRLDGVKDGRYPEIAALNDEDQRFYGPGLAWDIERQLLYVVHPDADRITLVDLAHGSILKQADIRPRVSLWERWWGLFLTVAEAKGGPATEKRAVLSADGKRLMVTGQRGEMTLPAGGQAQVQIAPLDLQVIATDDLTQLRRLNQPARDLWITPDGRTALLAPDDQHGLIAMDTERLDIHAQSGNAALYNVGFSPDSQYAYVIQYPSKNAPKHLQVLQVATLSIVAEREISGSYFELLPP